MTNGETMFLNIICEEICVTGGKVIHIDKNISKDEFDDAFWGNVKKHPKAKWEIYPMYINE